MESHFPFEAIENRPLSLDDQIQLSDGGWYCHPRDLDLTPNAYDDLAIEAIRRIEDGTIQVSSQLFVEHADIVENIDRIETEEPDPSLTFGQQYRYHFKT